MSPGGPCVRAMEGPGGLLAQAMRTQSSRTLTGRLPSIRRHPLVSSVLSSLQLALKDTLPVLRQYLVTPPVSRWPPLPAPEGSPLLGSRDRPFGSLYFVLLGSGSKGSGTFCQLSGSIFAMRSPCGFLGVPRFAKDPNCWMTHGRGGEWKAVGTPSLPEQVK